MKKPILPSPPHKPKEPIRFHQISETFTYYPDSGITNLRVIKEELERRACVPIEYQDILIERYYEEVEIRVKVSRGEQETPNYEHSLKKYNNALANYEKKMKTYEINKQKYDDDMKQYKEECQKQEIEHAKKILKKYGELK